MDPILLKPGEVAMLLGIGRSKAYEMIASSTLRWFRLRKCVRVPAESRREWVEAQLALSEQRDTDPHGTGSVPR